MSSDRYCAIGVSFVFSAIPLAFPFGCFGASFVLLCAGAAFLHWRGPRGIVRMKKKSMKTNGLMTKNCFTRMVIESKTDLYDECRLDDVVLDVASENIASAKKLGHNGVTEYLAGPYERVNEQIKRMVANG